MAGHDLHLSGTVVTPDLPQLRTSCEPEPANETGFMATLERLIIHQFRHVVPETELSFNSRTNVILGQNGAGKTTLLTLISYVTRMDFSQIAEVAFDLEWSLLLSGGTRTLRVRVKNQKRDRDPSEASPSPIPPEAQQASPTAGPSYTLTYEMHLTRPDGSHVLDVQWGDSPRVTVNGSPVQAIPPSPPNIAFALMPRYTTRRPNEPPDAVELDLSQAFSEVYQLRATYRFDEGLEMYRNLTGPVQDGPAQVPGRLFLRIGLRENRPFHLNFDFIPPSLVNAVFRSLSTHPSMSVPELRFNRSLMPFLERICRLMNFKDCELSLGLIKREATPDGLELVTLGNPKFHVTKHDDSIIQDQLLSYGQKRLLAFIYYLESSLGIAIVDELVNGFHHEWISGCLDLCQGRQLFLTSQNPLLLDNLDLDSLDDVLRTFIICRPQRPPAQLEQASWQNISPEAAVLLHKSLQVGFQSISELLRTQGLW